VAQLTETGLIVRTQDEIEDEIKADLRADISPSLNLTSTSILGILIGIFGEQLKNLEDLALAVYNSFTPDGASGTALTQLALLTGTERLAATKTTVTATVNLDDGTSFVAGDLIAHIDGDPSLRFVNTEAVSNSTGVADDFDVAFEAETAGATEVLAGTLTEIAEPQTGWNSVTNAEDGITGTENETDEELRLRREDELSAQGSTTADAIRSDVLSELEANVTHCRVLVNDTDETDDNGLPPHSIEVIARGLATGGDETADLAAVILDSKPAGIEAYGSTIAETQDSQGNTHFVGLTWVTETDVYLEIDLTVNSDYPADGDDQVAAAIVAVEDDYSPGDDVIAQRLKAAAFTVAGVVDVTALRLGTTASPVGTSNLTIGIREIADLDTSRVVVAS
jgi:uncharacterized phage protein gp47/JayE